MLQVDQIETGYGRKQVLFGLSLAVRPGEAVAVIGPNGSGQSTVLKTICGLIQPWQGEIRFAGETLNGSTPAANVCRGITFAPQGNRVFAVFADLSILENLEIGGCSLARKELRGRIEQVMDMFPILRQRSKQAANKLSGGEQQMVAIARALIPSPKLLMLDEPSLGLSPSVMKNVFEKIRSINRQNGVPSPLPAPFCWARSAPAWWAGCGDAERCSLLVKATIPGLRCTWRGPFFLDRCI